MPQPTNTHATLEEWIVRDAVAVDPGSPTAFEKAIETTMASLGREVAILGLGETIHGSEEILQLRNRLFRHLVRAHGFSAIAIESSYPRARLVNAYVTGSGPQSFDEIRDAGFGHGFGHVEANRELVEWIRDYNADPARRIEVHFYGMDMPGVMGGPSSPGEVLGMALDCLSQVDEKAAQRHRERIELHLGPDSDWENPMPWRDPAQSPALIARASALRGETEDLIAALLTRRPEMVARAGTEGFREAVHHARLARQLLTFFAVMARESDYGASLGVRDELIADNLAHIASRERERGRVLAFAHNKHLQCGRAEWQLGPMVSRWWPAGAHLRTVLGPRYAVIGTALGVSDDNGIGQPEPGTLESLLVAAPGPVRIIPTHGSAGLPAADIAKLPVRTGSVKNPTYFPLAPQSFTDFDWLMVLDSTAYWRGGRPLG